MNTAVRFQRPAPRFTALVAVLFCLLSVSVTPLPAQRRGARPAPVQESPAANPQVGLGLMLQEKAAGQRTVIEVAGVVPGSRAATAGVQVGDVLISAGGQPVTSVKQAQQVILAGVVTLERSGRPLPLRFQRGRSEVAVQIQPAGPNAAASSDRRIAARRGQLARGGSTLPSAPVEVVDPFLVPGLAPRDSSPAGINVLRRVFLDPKTGQLAFVGRYDPTYATGAIDYSTLPCGP